MSLRWSTVVAPKASEIALLCRELAIPTKLLSHALDPNEHPRLRSIGDVTFLLLRVPVVEPEGADVPFLTAPLGVAFSPRGGVIVAGRDSDVHQRLTAQVSASDGGTEAEDVVLRALELTAESFLETLAVLDARADAAEKRLARSLENREVLELLRYQKSLVYFSSALEGVFPIVERMQSGTGFRVSAAREEWLASVSIELRQALETSTLQRSVMSEMMDAFASIISNNLNVVMKFLATVTVLLTLPMIVTGLYGMNVDLPGQRYEHAFAATVLASLVAGVGLAAYFRRRGWI